MTVRGCTCIRQNLKEAVLRGTITRSEMGKQSIQAELKGLLLLDKHTIKTVTRDKAQRDDVFSAPR